ncbi:TetR/AcrR family transcriptional regulator [Streptomyces sp. NPDC056708]|uniref:TetR/AcrR family transcriptional regulator n=1 Tax=unclassified Streptomyces TaxID=2593676 RepID=UPI0036AD1180
MPAILSALRCRSVCSRIRQWRSLTVEDITERADVGRATFYSHFRDREDLFARVTADLLEELAERLQPVVSCRRTRERPQPRTDEKGQLLMR